MSQNLDSYSSFIENYIQKNELSLNNKPNVQNPIPNPKFSNYQIKLNQSSEKKKYSPQKDKEKQESVSVSQKFRDIKNTISKYKIQQFNNSPQRSPIKKTQNNKEEINNSYIKILQDSDKKSNNLDQDEVLSIDQPSQFQQSQISGINNKDSHSHTRSNHHHHHNQTLSVDQTLNFSISISNNNSELNYSYDHDQLPENQSFDQISEKSYNHLNNNSNPKQVQLSSRSKWIQQSENLEHKLQKMIMEDEELVQSITQLNKQLQNLKQEQN